LSLYVSTILGSPLCKLIHTEEEFVSPSLI
jgi:hypothetical protein